LRYMEVFQRKNSESKKFCKNFLDKHSSVYGDNLAGNI